MDVALVFAAGMVSFLSPCILPLTPSYLCYIGSRGRESAAERILAASGFVLGFSTVFVVLGASASALGGLLAQHRGWLNSLAGGIIFLCGLHMTGLLRVLLPAMPAFVSVGRISEPLRSTRLGPWVIGFAFAFGWSPCIGPVLAAVLALAATQASVSTGVGLLVVYCAGLGLPFVVAALLVSRLSTILRRVGPLTPMLSLAAGGVMIITGILILTSTLQSMGNALLKVVPALNALNL